MNIEPIRTLHGQQARWALKAQPHDPVPGHDGHFVIEKEVSIGAWTNPDVVPDMWVVIKCSCGQTFSGALR